MGGRVDAMSRAVVPYRATLAMIVTAPLEFTTVGAIESTEAIGSVQLHSFGLLGVLANGTQD